MQHTFDLKITSDAYKLQKSQINTFINTAQVEIVSITKEVEELKNWLVKYPHLSKFLLDLQENLQRPHIEFFNKLFTALKHDVLYSEMDKDELQEKANKVVFKPSFKMDRMALKILAQTPSGNDENITSGGEKNVIATGLRLLALWRLIASEKKQINKSAFSHRNFAFMDEPDCWISQKALPHYVSLLNQIVHDFNQQVLLVTHHNVELFKPFARVYKITNNGVYSKIELVSEPDELRYKNHERKSYIKQLELENFKTFKNINIELSPYFTVFVGESMAGKSAIMEAFNAIVYNDADDTVIRHSENKASVALTVINEENSVDLENNTTHTDYKEYRILWERVKKKTAKFTQKTRYKLLKTDEDGESGESLVLNEEYNSSDVPEFAVEKLKMKKIDGIDIHLGSQENMNFLFSSNITDFERAKILSLGKESAYINKMIEKLNSNKKEKQSEIKFLEKRLNRLVSVLEEYSLEIGIDIDDVNYLRLKSLEGELSDCQSILNDIEATIQILKDLYFLYNSLSNINLSNQVSLLQQLSTTINKKQNELVDIEHHINQHTVLDNANTSLNISQNHYEKIDFNHLNDVITALYTSKTNLKEIGVDLKHFLHTEKLNNKLISNVNLHNIELLTLLQNELQKLGKDIHYLTSLTNELMSLEKASTSCVFNKQLLGLLNILDDILNMLNGLPNLTTLVDLGKQIKNSEIREEAIDYRYVLIHELNNSLLKLQEVVLENLPVCPTCGSNLKHNH